MAKRWTPAMEKVAKKKAKEMAKHHGKEVKSTPTKEAWKRLVRNKLAVVGMILLALLIVMAVLAPVIAPYDYKLQNLDALTNPPSKEHIFGTDSYGRDILSRIMYGARYSLPIGFLCVICAFGVGGVLG
ncbi:MAG: ABC transporter permease, partial [Bacillota bacterium]|nr:ABC transporter permease [Bacillota bacterium]